MHPGEGVTKKEMFHTLGNPLRGRAGGSFPHLRGEHIDKCSNRYFKGKAENSQQRFLSNSTSQPRSNLHTSANSRGWGQGAGAQAWVSDPREMTRVGSHEDTLRGLLQQSGYKTGPD